VVNKRSINMKRISATRSAEVKAMLDFLRDLDQGKDGDLGGFNSFGIKYNKAMRGRINSYRAQKIANFLGKNISKSHLVKFSKGRDLIAQNDSTDSNKKKLTVDEFIEINKDSIARYYRVLQSFYVNEVNNKYDSTRS
jgi:hypothetical protein